MPELRILGRAIGPGHPIYFIAEAGSNHDRNFDQAMRLIDVAADAGADAVKFQTFRAEALYPRSAGMTDYLQVPKSIFDIIRELEMPLEWIPRLAAHARLRGLHFLSTPFDEVSADALSPHVHAFKIASYEMTHHPLVRHCAKKGKPLIVSTGTAHLDEVRELVDVVRAFPGVGLGLMQCTAKYPAPLDTLNLKAMSTMAETFGVPVGLSDHSREPLPGPLAAVALGASIIEKHFTLSNSLPGPDHAYALEPGELAELVRMIRAVERTLGDGVKRPHAVEAELRGFARRSIFVSRPVRQGERVGRAHLSVLRCGKLPYGLHPRDLLSVCGREAKRDLAMDATLCADDLGPLDLSDGPVRLRPLASTDTEQVVAWRNRPEVHRQLFASSPPTRESHEAWFATLSRRGDRLEFVILEEENPVGTIGLSNLDLGAGTGEFGILIGEPAARGRGIAAAASRLLLGHAFEGLDLKQVNLALYADNQAARRLYDRLGFVAAGEEVDPKTAGTGRARPVLRMVLRRDGTAA